MRIVVFGATGVLGRQVVPRLVERGHRVRAVVRAPERGRAFAAFGVELGQGDILDAESVARAVAGADAALHLATAIPKPGGAQDWTVNDRIRREGTRHLLAACERAGCRRYLQQSIAFLCGDTGTPAGEDAPLAENAFLESTHDMERLVRASSLDWHAARRSVLRPADLETAGSARAGTLAVPGDGRDRLSLVHVVDMARAVVLAAEAAPAGAIYHVVDDEPLSYRRLFDHMAALCAAPPPAAGGAPFLPAFAAANARITREIGWTPAYPTYRSGLT
jgi:nucleoside-diphosphate-sugar epimerase